MSLLLIDAYAMIYRAYYAFIKNPRINSQGLNTSAVFGFVNSLDDVIRRIAPTHIGIAFDPSGPTFRHEAYPAYKAQREQTPEDIRRSVPLIKQIISAMRIPILQVDGFEADDVIGTLAVQAHEMGMEVYMVTPDKDYGQLVQDGLWMYRPRHNGGFDKMGPQEVCQKYGIRTTAQVIDLLALMGDAADNVPGCPGVGEKTAVKLIGQFDSVENMLRNTDQIKGALQQKIVAYADDIRFSKFLTTIRTDVPVRIDPDSMLLQQPDTQELIRLYTELEFRTFVQRLTAQPMAQQPPAAQPDLFTQPDLFSPVADAVGAPLQQTLFDSVETTFEQHDPSKTDYQLVGDNQLDALISRLAAQRVVCFDTETTGIDPLQADLIGVSFCCSSGQAWFAYAPEDFDQCRRWADRLRPLLENPDIVKVGQNMKYDILVLSRYGIRLQGSCFDTMIAHYLLQPELRHNMDYMAEVYLNYQTIHYEDLVGPRGSQADLRKVPRERLRDYACEDADITFRLYLHFLPELEQRQLTDLFSNVEMPLVHVLADMERNGVRIDTQALRQSSDQLTAQMNELEQKIQASAGQPFNVNSPRQVGTILFDTLHLDPKAKKTKSGQYVTNEETLEALRGRHPIVDDILEYRAVKKLLSTYIDALPALINPQTGKIHTSYNQTVTSTGRLSSSNPNLQNIPVRTERGKEIRRAFIPDGGCVFVSADYSQIELRIMAHLSQDEHMIQAFRDGHDIHAATAARIYHVPIDEVTSDMRRKAKTANFGIIYGISAFGLAQRLGSSRQEAKELIDGYFSTYPKIARFIEQAKQQVRQSGYAETLLHRRRYLPDINSANSVVRGFAERNAVNAPIQGTAADIIKIAMVRISRRMQEEQMRSQMILQVHDELCFSVPLEEQEQMRQIVVEEMQRAMALSVPLIADCGIGANWLEAH